MLTLILLVGVGFWVALTCYGYFTLPFICLGTLWFSFCFAVWLLFVTVCAGVPVAIVGFMGDGLLCAFGD